MTMTRLSIIAALFLSACGPNVSPGPHVTAAENEPRTEAPVRNYTWPPADLIGRPCIGQGPGCYGGEFREPGYEPKPQDEVTK
jgi:hypothetical protein